MNDNKLPVPEHEFLTMTLADFFLRFPQYTYTDLAKYAGISGVTICHYVYGQSYSSYTADRIREGMKLQLRIEAINALNWVYFSGLQLAPNNAAFGFANTQRNLPRDIQIGGRFTF